ncbi:MAG: hypothetical protein OEY55_10075, partial [Acidimicrobiia bacterium]|nr:hypothetical protein [Acidimicrobiia bacterium]
AVFVLGEDRFSLEVDGEEWAGWHVSLITLSEIGVNEYEFNLNGDTVRFIPDSRLDFAYGAVPGLAKAQEAAAKGFRARRKAKKATRSSTSGGIPVASANSQPPAPTAAVRPTTVKAPKVAKAKVAKAKAEKPVAEKPVAKRPTVKTPADAEVAAANVSQTPPQAIDPTPADVVQETGTTAPVAAVAPPTLPRSVAAAVPTQEPTPETSPIAPGDPFTELVAAAPPTVPSNGELVIDLRAADDAKKHVATSESVQPAGNGHHPAHAAKPESKGGLRILERVRQSRAEHVHDYEVSSSGVMVRRVCSICNHVSIGTSD